MLIKKMIIPAVILILVSVSAKSQEVLDRSAYYTFGEELFLEAHVFPHESTDSVRVISLFKLLYNAMLFSQNEEEIDSRGRYKATPQIDFSFRDERGIIRKSSFWSDTVFVSKYEESVSKKKYRQGYLDLVLPKGIYTLTAVINDSYGNKDNTNELQVDANKDFFNKADISRPVFSFAGESTRIIDPFVLGGNIPFRADGAGVLTQISYKEPDIYYYSIEKTAGGTRYDVWKPDLRLSGAAELLRNKRISIAKELSAAQLTLELIDDDLSNDYDYDLGVIKVNIDKNTLVPGYYNLKLFKEGSADTLKEKFKVIWTEEPLSFKSLDYAIDAMYYILTEDEHDKMKKGSDKEQFKKLIEYWEKNDPTPGTPYNEKMVEYFERVDYAFFNFQTIAEKDGAKTDRGMIYILKGKPSEIETKLVDGNNRIIWLYDNIMKKYTFENVKTGVYRLISEEEL
ncbi:MAG: GWxTD domain-containing protein [Bacteroidota bacterium]